MFQGSGLRVEGVRVVKVGRLGQGAELRVRDLDREAAEVGGGCVVPRTPDAGCRVVPQDNPAEAKVALTPEVDNFITSRSSFMLFAWPTGE